MSKINGISIYPSKELRDKLNKKCKKENRSFNNLVIMILEKEVKE